MGAIHLPDELQRVIERQVAEGRAPNAAAFLEEAVLRLIDEARTEEEEVRSAAQVGISDVEAGRYVTVATPEDSRLLRERMMERLRTRLAAEQ